MSKGNHAFIGKVAVLGAGVMGAQIAAHCANAKVPVTLLDLKSQEGDPNQLVKGALKRLTKLKPAPLSHPQNIEAISIGNFDDDLHLLEEADLVIEAIAERLDWKQALYEKIGPHIADHAILATNTSGLSIETLAEAVPGNIRDRFCVVHFFNPPRYMRLVELVPHTQTAPEVLDSLESFLVSTLGKGVIRGKDTPNFVANRIGVFSMLATMHHTQVLGLSFDLADKLTGPTIKRAKSATYRTMDVVGLDTMGHVVGTMEESLPSDPWHSLFKKPEALAQLITNGALGQKTGAGFYKKEGKVIKVFNTDANDYQDSTASISEPLQAILKIRDTKEQFQALRASDDTQAQFLWCLYRDLFHYCAVQLESIADTARDLDLAIRWGFGWAEGPFETWQKAGWQQVAQWIQEDIAANQTLAQAALPGWVLENDFAGPYQNNQAFSPASQSFKGRSDLAVYKRQFKPEAVLGEDHDKGKTLHECEGVRLWTTGDDIGILSFKSKLGTMGEEVLEGIRAALKVAENQCRAVVIWQDKGAYFSVGANLKQVADYIQAENWTAVDNYIANFQITTQAVRYASIPVVGAVQGYALGGGCELMMHCDRRVTALETYAGLVEVGVGVIPAGGGCKEMTMKAAALAQGGDPLPHLQKFFRTLAMGEMGLSAEEVRQKGFLTDSDSIVFHPDELLHVAKSEANALAEANYRPPLSRNIPVVGREGLAALRAELVNYLEGHFISEHDFFIANQLAEILCGGEVDAGTLVDENWLLDLERKVFIALVKVEKTQDRIVHMLKTGKPLRN